MFQIIASNLLRYDIIILILAAINGFFIYPKVKHASKTLKEDLQPKVYVPIQLLMERFKGMDPKKMDLSAMKRMRSVELRYYSIFTTVNSAFPMLGMLGTVLSLLKMTDLSQEQVVLNFTVALTSTLWGLIFALIFKAFDATLYPMVEQNKEDLNLILERLDLASRYEGIPYEQK